MAQFNVTLNEEILHQLFSGNNDGLARLLEQVLNQILEAQRTAQLQADPYERRGYISIWMLSRNGRKQSRYLHPLRIARLVNSKFRLGNNGKMVGFFLETRGHFYRKYLTQSSVVSEDRWDKIL